MTQTALILVDIQNDYFAGGRMALPPLRAHEAISPSTRWVIGLRPTASALFTDLRGAPGGLYAGLFARSEGR